MVNPRNVDVMADTLRMFAPGDTIPMTRVPAHADFEPATVAWFNDGERDAAQEWADIGERKTQRGWGVVPALCVGLTAVAALLLSGAH
jgi:hypothetical protein